MLAEQELGQLDAGVGEDLWGEDPDGHLRGRCAERAEGSVNQLTAEGPVPTLHHQVEGVGVTSERAP